MKIIVGVMTPILLSLGSGALAAPQEWRITETAGDVRLVEGGRARAATRGALLSSGSMIATGANSRAVIVRGQEYVVVSPRSRLRVPLPAESRDGLMQMITDFGTSMFKIEKKSMPHFGVQTPYLVALVKGTTFTVSVGPGGGSVQVTEGAVQVSTLDGGASELVRPGDIATVGASDLYQLTIEGDVSKVIRSEGAPAGVVTSSVSAPVADTAAPAILAAGAAQPPYDGPPAQDVVITSAVAAEPSSLSELTDGLLEDSMTELAVALLGQQAREAGAVPAAGPTPEPGGPAPDPVADEPGQGSGDAVSGEGGGEAPVNGDAPATPAGGSDEDDEDEANTPGGGSAPGQSDDGDKPGQGDDDGDKPGKGDDEPDKGDDDGDKPDKGDDDGGKPDKPDKGDDDGGKPDKGDDDGDKPDKPGKGDDDGDKPGKPDKGDDDGDKPDKGDDDGDKPGKGDDDDDDKSGKSDDDDDKHGKGDD